MNRIFLFFLNIFGVFVLQGQSSGDPFINARSLEALKKGHLLVRLESHENKLTIYQKSRDREDCDAGCKNRLDRQMADIKSQRDSFNHHFMQAFKTRFRFSPVLFYYDKDHKNLKAADFSGPYFLDEFGHIKTVSGLHRDRLLILKKSVTPGSEVDGWMFETAAGQNLEQDFPYITENNFKTMMNRLGSSDHVRKNCIHMVRQLNKNLFAYSDKIERKRRSAMDARDESED